MPAIVWDQVGSRFFEAGVDHGVLYLSDEAIPWNGLIGVDDSPSIESKAYYQDGVKYLDVKTLGEYSGKLKALTYPEEFESVQGNASTGKGLFVHDQPGKRFGLSYRTGLGDDISGLDRGYRIHILYNLCAVPDDQSFSSVAANVEPLEFSWTLTSTPIALRGHRPTAHISIKSTELDPDTLAQIEEKLYGGVSSIAYLPTIKEIYDLIENQVVVVDNGDGSWTATGSDQAVELLSATTFQLTTSKATYLDEGTYEIITDT